MTMARRMTCATGCMALIISLAACADTGDSASTQSPRTSSSSGVSASSGSSDTVGGSSANTGNGERAITVLASLPIKGRAPKTGYARTQFGAAWADVDGNGCDTRNDILNRDMTNVTYKSGTHNCVVATGTLADPYTGRTIHFQRGQNTSTAVQIDHVVALSDAWQKGAQQLSADTRKHLANDPYNLLAVDGPSNEQKSDGDAATWLPANKSYRCAYVARQIGVKSKYSLWVTQAEHDAMESVLASCPSQTVPADNGLSASASSKATPSVTGSATSTPTASASPSPTVESTPTVSSSPTASTQSSSDVYYANCSAVRAAGKAPLYKGQPGYSTKLDRDGDGVACE
ncbi:DUF1524 domain-containing protein [Bifidobacterium sp. SMB2]|uniref:DUF1524 domain-containing protein n=2 Tax=Bifidobacterium TaxID=1678 RepID=A0ABX0CA83_9BIFI|nr:DUF1524 domain-containing protein [Bifidobacterium sp. SMB2]NEH12044.1 DUF1524 domain-containing protein [Bifidobacterium saimiriisciurei]